MPVDFAVNVKHDHSSKRFWMILNCCFHICFNIFLPNLICNKTLCFSIKRISPEHHLSQSFPFSSCCFLLSQNLSESAEIPTKQGISQSRVVLFKHCQLVRVSQKHVSNERWVIFISSLSIARSIAPWCGRCSGYLNPTEI